MPTQLTSDVRKAAIEVAKKLINSTEETMPVPGAKGISVSKKMDKMLVLEQVTINDVKMNIGVIVSL